MIIFELIPFGTSDDNKSCFCLFINIQIMFIQLSSGGMLCSRLNGPKTSLVIQKYDAHYNKHAILMGLHSIRSLRKLKCVQSRYTMLPLVVHRLFFPIVFLCLPLSHWKKEKLLNVSISFSTSAFSSA